MDNMILLNDDFPDAKGYKTEKNARLALEKAFNTGLFYNMRCFVMKRKDGLYLPVVIHNDRKESYCNIPALCIRNICVIN